MKFAARRGNGKRLVRDMPGGSSWRDGSRCVWCGRGVFYKWRGHPLEATREHVVPKGKGGSSTKENVVVACAQCNHKRGMRTDWIPYEQLRLHDQHVSDYQWRHLLNVGVVSTFLAQRRDAGLLVVE